MCKVNMAKGDDKNVCFKAKPNPTSKSKQFGLRLTLIRWREVRENGPQQIKMIISLEPNVQLTRCWILDIVEKL